MSDERLARVEEAMLCVISAVRRLQRDRLRPLHGHPVRVMPGGPIICVRPMPASKLLNEAEAILAAPDEPTGASESIDPEMARKASAEKARRAALKQEPAPGEPADCAGKRVHADFAEAASCPTCIAKMASELKLFAAWLEDKSEEAFVGEGRAKVVVDDSLSTEGEARKAADAALRKVKNKLEEVTGDDQA